MCGFELSSGQFSNLNKQLDSEFEKWLPRTLPRISSLPLDATYYNVRIDGVVRDCAKLIAHSIRRADGTRMILGVSCSLSEAEVHWREFLASRLLVIHGEADGMIAPSAGKALSDALPLNKVNEWLLVPDAGHDNIPITDYRLYSTMAEWLVEGINPPTGD